MSSVNTNRPRIGTTTDQTQAAQPTAEPAKPAAPAAAETPAAAPAAEAAPASAQATSTSKNEATARFASDPRAMQHAQKAASLKVGHSDEEGHVHGKGGGKATTDLGDKFKYGNTVNQTVNKPIDPKLLSAANLAGTNKQLDDEVTKRFPKGVTFDPPVKAGSKEAAEAKWALLNTVSEKGAQTDAVVNIAGKNQLMTIDETKKGAATVTIADKTPGVTTTFKTQEEAKACLEKKYGVVVSDKPNTFTKEELEKTNEAFSRMSPDEQKALKGVTLERHDSIPNHPERAAEFGWKSGVAKDGTAIKEQVLRVGDGTFSSDNTAFVGDGKNAAPRSVQTLVHEAGHAVESAKQREKSFKVADGEVAFEGGRKDVNTAIDGWNKASKGSKDKSVGAYQSAAGDVQKKLQSLHDAKTPDQVTARQAALDKAVQKRDTAAGKLPAGLQSDAKALSDAQDKQAKGAAQTGNANAELSQVATGGKSQRLADFEKFTKDNKIKPVTDYGATSSAEAYAEAYSLYKTDPGYLKANSPKLYEYFENNKHAQ